MNLAVARAHLRRHGVVRTAVAYTLAGASKVVTFEILRVETAAGAATEAPDPPGYETRLVDADEFMASIGRTAEHDRRFAFERGDRCFANLAGDDIVGYAFYSFASQTYAAGVDLCFPPRYMYLYSAYTHPEHRGKRLSLARGNARRRMEAGRAEPRRILWVVRVDNYASRRSSVEVRPELVGYLAYARVGGRVLTWASPGCRRESIRLVPSESSGGG